MSINNCAASGEPLQHPVISKKGGYVYEKRVIEKILESSSQDPVTGEPLSKEDLIELKLNPVIKPRSINTTSIPGLINVFQSEWDSLVAEMFQLKQHLDSTRKELSHALYQHDAACRVIARVVKERDEARQQITQLTQEMQNFRENGAAPYKNGDSSSALPESVINEITTIGVDLNTSRKKKKKDPNAFAEFATADMINNFKLSDSVDAFTKGKKAINCIEVDQSDKFVVLGGLEGEIKIYDKTSKKFVQTLSHHTDIINDISLSSNSTEEKLIGLSGSNDSKAVVFSYEPEGKKVSKLYEVNQHKGAITGVSFHKLASLAIVGSLDGSYSLHDINTSKMLLKQELQGAQINALRVHPDAQFLALGQSNGIVKLWNITSNEMMGEIETGHSGNIKQIAFSENGYHFATLGENDHKAKIWDLRYLTAISTLHQDKTDFNAYSIDYDPSGQFFAVGGPSLLLHTTKAYDNFTKFNIANSTGKDHISAIKFGGNSKSILIGTSNGALNIYK